MKPVEARITPETWRWHSRGSAPSAMQPHVKRTSRRVRRKALHRSC